MKLTKLLINFFEYYKNNSNFNDNIIKEISNILNPNNNNNFKSI